jgi:hypothetical protein
MLIIMNTISESDVSIKSLINIFESAYLKVIDVADDLFWVKCDKLKVKITIDEKRKFILLRIVYALAVRISVSDAMRIVNKVNDEYNLIRFSSFEYDNDSLVTSDYFMTYENGLIPYHLIHMTKTFEKYTVVALTEEFSNYI